MSPGFPVLLSSQKTQARPHCLLWFHWYSFYHHCFVSDVRQARSVKWALQYSKASSHVLFFFSKRTLSSTEVNIHHNSFLFSIISPSQIPVKEVTIYTAPKCLNLLYFCAIQPSYNEGLSLQPFEPSHGKWWQDLYKKLSRDYFCV